MAWGDLSLSAPPALFFPAMLLFNAVLARGASNPFLFQLNFTAKQPIWAPPGGPQPSSQCDGLVDGLHHVPTLLGRGVPFAVSDATDPEFRAAAGSASHGNCQGCPACTGGGNMSPQCQVLCRETPGITSL